MATGTVDWHNCQGDAIGVGQQGRRRREFLDELSHQEWLPILDALGEPHLGKRPADEIAGLEKAALEHRSCAAADSDVSGLHDLECDQRGLDQVSQFMRKEPETLVLTGAFAVDRGLMTFASVLSDGARHRVVQARVEQPKIVRADRGTHFHGQLGDRLTDIAVIVHDLRDAETSNEKVVPVQDGAPANLRTRREPEAQRIGELTEKQRYAVIDLCRRGGRY
jgi:hypothetical protein